MHLLDTITYLQHGTVRQQESYDALTANTIIEKLHAFTPILAGTIPLNIDIKDSDLDILCYWQDQDDFINTLKEHFKDYDRFTLKQAVVNDQKTVIANFWCEGFDIEIFGQNIPVKQQMGYMHMIAEYNILKQNGDAFRQKIIALKNAGYKTEPAFAKLLGLSGDPYTVLLRYKY